MAKYISIRQGTSAHPEQSVAHLTHDLIYQTGVVDLTSDWKVSEHNPQNMSVDIAQGRGFFKKQVMTYHGYSDAVENITIGANNSGNPRIDAVVLYVDLSATPNSDASNVLKSIVVQGTPASSPVAPTDNEIQTAIGSGNPFLRLANVYVANGASAITNANITDTRVAAYLKTPGGIKNCDDITLNNNKGIKQKDSDGTVRDILNLNPSNDLEIGGDGISSYKLNNSTIKPKTDSTSAIKITKADGITNVLNIDTTNERIGIGVNPTAKLHIKTNDLTTVPVQVDALVGLPGWNYRKPITISNSGSALTDYQVLVTLDTASLISAGKMRSDGGDIRFTDSDGSTLLSYWIESGINTSSTKIWVKVPSIPANSTKTIYVYYGNPSATSLSNGDNVFDFFDDFLGTNLDENKWTPQTETGTSITVSGGVVRLRSTPTNDNPVSARIITKKIFTAPYIVEGRFALQKNLTNGFVYRIAQINDASNGLSHYNGNPYSIYNNYAIRYGALSGNDFGPDGNNIIVDTDLATSSINYHKTVYQWVSGNIKYWRDGVLIGSSTQNFNLGQTNIKFIVNSWGSANDGSLYIDYVFVRKYTSSEPTISIGTEETPQPQQQTVFYIENGSGNVGIGTTSPGYKLDINGQCRASSFQSSSDKRFKENIKEISNALDKVKKLRGVYFNWNKFYKEILKLNVMRDTEIGVIAQEIKEVIPEVVTTFEKEVDGKKEKYYSVEYARLSALLINAIKELAEKVENLEKK